MNGRRHLAPLAPRRFMQPEACLSQCTIRLQMADFLTPGLTSHRREGDARRGFMAAVEAGARPTSITDADKGLTQMRLDQQFACHPECPVVLAEELDES